MMGSVRGKNKGGCETVPKRKSLYHPYDLCQPLY
jgi:hypothetical protein